MDELKHYGVKGMKWGVINERDSSNEKLQAHIDKAKQHKFTKEEQDRIDKTKAQHDAKFGPIPFGEKGWRPTGKQVAYTVAGAAVVGVLIYGAVGNKGVGHLFVDGLPNKIPAAPELPTHFSKDDYAKVLPAVAKPTWLPQPGSKMEPHMYDGLVDSRSGVIWSGNYCTRDLLDEPSFSLPTDHQFFRLTSQKEKTFSQATYAVTSEPELARYYASFSDGHRLNVAKFKAKEPIKVAHLKDQLDAMEEVLTERHPGMKPSPQMVASALAGHSGGSFSTGEGRALLSTLKARGHGGLVDLMDAGIYGEKPVVLFAPEKLTSKVTTKVSKDYAKQLGGMVTEISNRR